MKTIKVQITAYPGNDIIRGEKIGSRMAQILISDDAAAILRKMLETLPTKTDEGRVIDQDDLMTAIKNGHDELRKVRAQIIDHGRELVTRYRISKIDKAAKDEAIEHAFWQDIEDDIYRPALSLDEFREYQAETADDEAGEEVAEYLDDMYFDKYREEYVSWIQSHLASDYRFVADRIGVDSTDIFSGEADDHIFYAITEIEQ